MDTHQLLTASVLDIIFEGRNKEYGAYCLRKEYNGRLKKSMITTGLIVSLVILLFSFNSGDKSNGGGIIVSDTIVIQPPPTDPIPEPVPPPKPAAPPPMVKTVQFTSPPKIVADKDVKPGDKPPENNSLDNVKIDVFSQDGPETDFGIAPPQGTSTGVIGSVAAYRNPDDSVFIGVQVESTYPGGPKAWARFLNKTFIYPQYAIENGIQGTVNVRFIVDQSGNANNIEAMDGPEELKAEAIRVIKKSGKWNPAIQNGRIVKSYKRQPVVFKLTE